MRGASLSVHVEITRKKILFAVSSQLSSVIVVGTALIEYGDDARLSMVIIYVGLEGLLVQGQVGWPEFGRKRRPCQGVWRIRTNLAKPRMADVNWGNAPVEKNGLKVG